ncbi:P-loop containing nucleoside triphosphate hydrolase protein [Ramaria rubella]|nr:P-loop containing nucleoside triphosphate hydrolase protein [Ramaria rubella]
MRGYLSLSSSKSSRRNRESIAVVDWEKSPLNAPDASADNVDQSTRASIIPALAPALNLKVKKVDHFYSRWSKKWKYQNSGSNAIPELRPLPVEGKDDPWQQYCFVVIREIPREDEDTSFRIVVKSPYLLKACKDVIGEVQGVSWNAVPLQLDPKLLIAFLPQLQTYRDGLEAKTQATEEERNVMATVDVLLEYFRKDYRSTLASIENNTSHGEITFELLYAIFVPRSIMITTNPVTGELQALQLASVSLVTTAAGVPVYSLLLEGIDVDDSDSSRGSQGFARIQNRIMVCPFAGTIQITSLEAYPIQYHPREAELRQSLLARGRKWAEIAGDIHHMYYKGAGVMKSDCKIIKYNLDSRVMIDRANFRKFNPNYAFPTFKQESRNPFYLNSEGQPPMILSPGGVHHGRDTIPLLQNNERKRAMQELTEEELLLVSPIVYGFSLADKLWLEFNVEKIEQIEWNEDAFSNLVLPSDRKTLLQSLVEAHNTEVGFDDFIKGKGRGLVVNLFGPPGVGKTLSAEATSEHVKRPLYVVGAGDLGMQATELDQELQRVFELATAWRAIVLIDEADVFLEQRSLHDLQRNAMVAVFLRHLEYYPAILFLTTNRVKTFDEAFLSRIHIALHFHPLSKEARSSVWTAFLKKAGVEIGTEKGVSKEELEELAERDINGRQVKNATRTANSLAVSRGEALRYEHLTEVLDVMEKFSTDFQTMRAEVPQ